MERIGRGRDRRGTGPVEGRPPAIASRLLEWYRRARRDLPWRRHPDPYRVWISEAMLQQTRVEVVIPRYLRFLERFPDVRSLAEAREDEVIAEWSGLGYYRRARALHAAARIIRERHGGEFPPDLEAARALPGVGPYTAGAVLSIAYGIPAPVVDGNVERVLTRLLRLAGDPRAPAAAGALRDAAARLIPEGAPGDFNQAMMELGALVCLPAAPRCGECPLAASCRARRAGDPERFPARAPRRPIREVHLAAAVIERGGLHLLEKRDATGPTYLRGLWGFPSYEGTATAAALARRVEESLGIRARPGGLAARFSHAITFRKVRVRAFRLVIRGRGRDARSRSTGIGPTVAWHRLDRLGVDLPASSLALKIKAALGGSR